MNETGVTICLRMLSPVAGKELCAAFRRSDCAAERSRGAGEAQTARDREGHRARSCRAELAGCLADARDPASIDPQLTIDDDRVLKAACSPSACGYEGLRRPRRGPGASIRRSSWHCDPLAPRTLDRDLMVAANGCRGSRMRRRGDEPARMGLSMIDLFCENFARVRPTHRPRDKSTIPTDRRVHCAASGLALFNAPL